MARPALQDAPFQVSCKICNKCIDLAKHHRSKWRKGQRNFYCSHECSVKSRVGQPRPDFALLLKGNKRRVGMAPTNKKYFVNKEYFKHINDSDKAYWLGYIAADGNIYEAEKNYFVFSVGSIDYEQVDRLKSAVGYNGPIDTRKTTHKDMNTLAIRDSDFCINLIKLGIIPRKTFLLKYPYFLSNENMKHYIRGYLDGDGSITINKEHIQFNIVGTYDLIKNIASFLKSKGVLKSDGIFKQENVYRLQRTQLQAISFLNYIYEGAGEKMQRKYDKYIKYKETFPCKFQQVL